MNAMRIAGQRVKRTKWIHTDRYVVAVEVEAVTPVDDPSEPCFEAETVKHLKQVKEHADQGDLDWLKRHGRVYAALEAAMRVCEFANCWQTLARFDIDRSGVLQSPREATSFWLGFTERRRFTFDVAP